MEQAREPPKLGHRAGWRPAGDDDYGDGGGRLPAPAPAPRRGEAARPHALATLCDPRPIGGRRIRCARASRQLRCLVSRRTPPRVSRPLDAGRATSLP